MIFFIQGGTGSPRDPARERHVLRVIKVDVIRTGTIDKMSTLWQVSIAPYAEPNFYSLLYYFICYYCKACFSVRNSLYINKLLLLLLLFSKIAEMSTSVTISCSFEWMNTWPFVWDGSKSRVDRMHWVLISDTISTTKTLSKRSRYPGRNCRVVSGW